jgi:hypothetical protein
MDSGPVRQSWVETPIQSGIMYEVFFVNTQERQIHCTAMSAIMHSDRLL